MIFVTIMIFMTSATFCDLNDRGDLLNFNGLKLQEIYYPLKPKCSGGLAEKIASYRDRDEFASSTEG